MSRMVKDNKKIMVVATMLLLLFATVVGIHEVKVAKAASENQITVKYYTKQSD